MSDHLAVCELRNESDFLVLRDDWNKLIDADHRATIFQTWEFQYHAWRMTGAPDSLCMATVRNQTGNLVGCAPLAVTRWGFGPAKARILEFASGPFCDYGDFLIHADYAESVLKALSAWLRQNLHRWDVVRFRGVREDSWVNHANLFFSKLACPFTAVQVGTAPYLSFKTSWSSYEDALDHRHASILRYKVKKLFRNLNCRLESAAAGPSLERALHSLMELHQQRMRSKGRRSFFSDPAVRTEFGTLVKRLAARRLAQVYTLVCDQKTIAAICIFKFRGTMFFYQGGFDTTCSRLSPGVVLHCLCITEGIRDKARQYDFLQGREPYKFIWANEERLLYDFEFLTKAWQRILIRWCDRTRLFLSRRKWARRIYYRCLPGHRR
ncbi:MAG TPA: GNAT family N-acetyltransferase [Candidatus Binatia bacterium]|nr:GNAT family N-acetyltransferase [Candidatus Binatia bacterium]